MNAKKTFGLAVVMAGLNLWMVRAEVSVSLEIRSSRDFYEPLGRHGHWVEVERHGRCWRPSYVASDWQPYASGYWLWSDGGWYWGSEEPWAWATYHYGRWFWDSYHGWVWVPGTEWAPAWVSWREGGDYIGWAPLPPDCDFDPITGVILYERIRFAPHAYVFIEHRHFCEPIRPAIIIHHTVVQQTIMNQTVHINPVRRVDRRIINIGPNVEIVRRNTGQEVHTRPVHDLRRGTPPPPIVRVPSEPATSRRDEPGDRSRHAESPRRLPEIIRSSEREASPPSKPPVIRRGLPTVEPPSPPPSAPTISPRVEREEKRERRSESPAPSPSNRGYFPSVSVVPTVPTDRGTNTTYETNDDRGRRSTRGHGR